MIIELVAQEIFALFYFGQKALYGYIRLNAPRLSVVIVSAEKACHRITYAGKSKIEDRRIDQAR